MQLTPRELLQQSLGPALESEIGPLTPQLGLVASVMAMAPLGRFLAGRP